MCVVNEQLNSGVVTTSYVVGGGVVLVIFTSENTVGATCPGVDGGWNNVTIVFRVLQDKCG